MFKGTRKSIRPFEKNIIVQLLIVMFKEIMRSIEKFLSF